MLSAESPAIAPTPSGTIAHSQWAMTSALVGVQPSGPCPTRRATCYTGALSMPVPSIFLIDNSGGIVEMTDRPYDSEDLLQQLLAKYPSVLAGNQLNTATPVKWLLVEREAGIPGEDGGTDRWSLDHIFIDQDGIPTLVEVKRSTDTRIRREVVGQMLDYAANAVLYWPVETIRLRFEETCRETEADPSAVVAEFLDLEEGIDTSAAIARFWEVVETNLRAGKIRLVFAADVIPPELRRVVEFLNEQMNPAEVLAIEIRQYVGTGVRTLVPSVIGSPKRTAAASGQPAVQWDRESFVAALRERSPADVAVATAVWEWTANYTPDYWWGQGRRDGSCTPGFTHKGVRYFPFTMWTSARIEMQFKALRHRSVSAEAVKTVAEQLNAIPGITITPEALTKWPSFDMAAIRDRATLSQFFDAMQWCIGEIRRT
jgi:hypothetical protein